jgi:trigger factor
MEAVYSDYQGERIHLSQSFGEINTICLQRDIFFHAFHCMTNLSPSSPPISCGFMQGYFSYICSPKKQDFGACFKTGFYQMLVLNSFEENKIHIKRKFMNISRENTGELTAILRVEIGEADYAEKVNTALNDLKRKANIPGFRAGKVPMGIVKKMYAVSVMADEVNKVLTDSLNKYVVDEKLNILGNPIPHADQENIDFNTQKDFAFSFDIGLSPEITLELNKDIHVPYSKIEVAQSMVDDYVKDIQERFGEHAHPEKIEETSKITASFKQLDAEGNVLEGGIAQENASFNMQDIKLKTVVKTLVGKAKGDIVNMDPMHALKDANKVSAMFQVAKIMVEDLKAEFEMEIKEILFITPAEINEELFKQAYPSAELKTEDDLRARIKEDAEKQFEGESDKLFMGTAVEQLIEKAGITLPDSFMKRWILDNNKGELSEEQIDVQYDSYANTLKWQLLQNKIIADNDLQVSQEEVREHVKGFISGQYFGGMEQNEALAGSMDGIVDNVMKNQEEVKKIYDQLYDNKILLLFKESLSLDTENMPLDDFIKKASEAPKA